MEREIGMDINDGELRSALSEDEDFDDGNSLY
jgi:hypothetical protein